MAISVHKAKAADIEKIVELDHGYTTEYVWQMDIEQEGSQINVRFREVRLPRSMTVAYPRSVAALAETWKKQAALMVAKNDDNLVGYISLATRIAPGACWATDLAVNRLNRRQGIGTKLVLAAQSWALEQGCSRLVLEMQSKNQPAIRFAQKLAFEFCGYNDRYYDNQDIALFFAKHLT